MLEDVAVVSLKRKVRSPETNLLEWRRCACTLASDSSQLILELSDDDVDDVVLDDAADGDDSGQPLPAALASAHQDQDESRRGKCRVAIDLGSQLKRVEQKRKNKTRCEIEYYWDAAANGGGSSSSSHMDRRVRVEELMASSAKHCQQFIDQVREAERQAKRKQSIRLGAVLAAAAAAAGSGSGISVSSGGVLSSEMPRSVRSSQISPPTVHTDRFRAPATNALSASSAKSSSDRAPGALGASLCSSVKSEEISPPSVTSTALAPAASVLPSDPMMPRGTPPSVNFDFSASFQSSTSSRQGSAAPTMNGEQTSKFWSQSRQDERARDCESDTLDSSSGVISPRATATRANNPAHPANNNQSDLASSQVSNVSSSSSMANKILLASKPLPQELFAQRLASLRTGADRQHQPQNQQHSDDDDDDDESFDNRRRARMEKLFSPQSARTPRLAGHSNRFQRRRPSIGQRADATDRDRINGARAMLRGTHTRRRNSGVTASVAAVTANLSRLRLRDRNADRHRSVTGCRNDDSAFDDGEDGPDGDSNNRAELHILMRVESALRQLEKENALAKEREALLAQEVQSLRDALRVKSAEKKHVETQFQQLAREKDEWKQVAQRAECAITQMEDELLIAKEEAQLLQSERVRLKHQNKELLTQVHRLDSLVYGRF